MTPTGILSFTSLKKIEISVFCIPKRLILHSLPLSHTLSLPRLLLITTRYLTKVNQPINKSTIIHYRTLQNITSQKSRKRRPQNPSPPFFKPNPFPTKQSPLLLQRETCLPVAPTDLALEAAEVVPRRHDAVARDNRRVGVVTEGVAYGSRG